MPPVLRTLLCVLIASALSGASVSAGGAGFGIGVEGLPGGPVRAAPRDAATVTASEPAAVRPGSWTSVPVRVDCPPDYYAWHDSFRATLGDGPDGLTVTGLALPPAKEKYDETLERTVAYLDGAFEVGVGLRVPDGAAPGEYPVRLTLRYTLCGPDLCRFDQAALQVTLVVDPAAAPAAGPEPPGSPPEAAELVAAAAGEDPFAGHSPLVVVLLAYLLGLGLTLTPCVYPLIPVTIGVVGATSAGGRVGALLRSLLYVLGISITYSAVGVVAAAGGGLFGQVANGPAVSIALAVAFVLLAGGMFDVYTIDLSSQRLQRLQLALRGKAGLAGVLDIGMLSGAAATACIAPVIVAALGYVATSGSLLLGWTVFFAMAWGMGTPLVLVGTFAGLAQSLPKSGQWMVTVKHALGGLLLACAVWFVMKSRLLPALWAQMLLGGGLLVGSVFVGAFDSLAPDAGRRLRLRKAVGLLLLAGAVMAFVQPVWTRALPGAAPAGQERGVDWLESEEEALALAAAEGRPVLLDFWSETCAPCLRMFRTTFVDPRVVAESRRFVCAKIDVDALSEEQTRRMREAYNLRGVPTIVLIDTEGHADVVTREVNADDMLDRMRATR